MLEAATSCRSANIRPLMPYHLIVHVLVRALIRISKFFIDIAPVSTLRLRLRLIGGGVATVVSSTDITVRLGHG